MNWYDWMDRHASLFPDFGDDGGRALLVEWVDVLAAAGGTPAAMATISAEMARSDVPAQAAVQLRALRTGLANLLARDGRDDEAPDAASRFASCDACDHTGYVTVPTAKTMRGGSGWFTAAVTCRCPLGKYLHAIKVAGRVAIDDYEEIFPDWREKTEDHQRRLVAYGTAMVAAEARDSRPRRTP